MMLFFLHNTNRIDYKTKRRICAVHPSELFGGSASHRPVKVHVRLMPTISNNWNDTREMRCDELLFNFDVVYSVFLLFIAGYPWRKNDTLEVFALFLCVVSTLKMTQQTKPGASLRDFRAATSRRKRKTEKEKWKIESPPAVSISRGNPFLLFKKNVALWLWVGSSVCGGSGRVNKLHYRPLQMQRHWLFMPL